jgi:hypothetical protein
MNTTAIAKNYDTLTPEERFRLIFAASGRGDEAERDRLTRAAERITLTMPAHCPYSYAFDELSTLTYIELLEQAASYHDANERAMDALDEAANDAEGADDDAPEESEESQEKETAEPTEEHPCNRPLWQRFLSLTYALGYVLRAKTEGWKLFCERLNVPPFLLWQLMPGFDRLQRTLSVVEKAAFTPDDFLHWLNNIRPAGRPDLVQVPLTVEALAAEMAQTFQARVEWFGG